MEEVPRLESIHKPRSDASSSNAPRAPNSRKVFGQSEQRHFRHVYCGRKFESKLRSGCKTEEERGAIGNLMGQALPLVKMATLVANLREIGGPEARLSASAAEHVGK